MLLSQLQNFSSLIWSLFFFPALLLCAGLLTVGSRGLQFRMLGRALALPVVAARRKHRGALRAAATSLGSTVGTGNIVGSAQAVAMGGPGALFWMWLAALVGMIVKYAEIALCIRFRDGSAGNGPMDYMEKGLGRRCAAKLYAALALLSAFGMGNLVQVNSITEAVLHSAELFVRGAPLPGLPLRLSVGLLLAASGFLLLSGGVERIGRASELLVPLMALLYAAVSIGVIAANAARLPAVLSSVVRGAFAPASVLGGAAGIGLSQCFRWGVRRSAFSNEAGLGTAAIAHAAAEADSPAEHGLWGVFEVFVDTVVICSLTALSILCSPAEIPYGSLAGLSLYAEAAASLIGRHAARCFVALCLMLFSYTSVISWLLYGGRCAGYLLGQRGERFFRLLFPLTMVAGSLLPMHTVWVLSDLINALLSIPNLLALLALTPAVLRLSERGFP